MKLNRVIVCGYGVVGAHVVDDIIKKSSIVTVIEINPALSEKIKAIGAKVIVGDATHSDVLKEAGIEKSDAIAILMDDDAKNLFSVITARDLNKNIFITTRANDEFVRSKLIDAGADYIVMPKLVASREILKQIKSLK